VPADEAENLVIEAFKTMTLPPRAIDKARAELARRLGVPAGDLVGAKRRRLETRFARLPKLFAWGDLADDDYLKEMAETRTMLADLPDPNKLVAFGRNGHVMVTMAENVGRATRPQLEELVQLLVERVQATGRTVDPSSIEWTPPARPFFEEPAWVVRPGRVRTPDTSYSSDARKDVAPPEPECWQRVPKCCGADHRVGRLPDNACPTVRIGKVEY
jgi:hypothetical protein